MRNRTKEEVECNQFPIYIYLFQSLVPHSPVTIYIGGIFIFLYKSYLTRVSDIRKYVNEQTMIESKKKRETNMRMREQVREKSVFEKGDFQEIFITRYARQNMFIKRKKF